MLFLSRILVIICIIQIFMNYTSFGYNYCGKKPFRGHMYCKDHSMCFPQRVLQKCTYVASVPMTRKMIHAYVDQHNLLRDETAAGRVKCKLDGDKTLGKATRLRELIWDHELSYIASVHNVKCTHKHDGCRATKKFRGSGQNISGFSKTSEMTDMTWLARQAVRQWGYERGKIKSVDLIKTRVKSVAGIGHFLVAVNERTAYVGCAMSYCKCGKRFHGYYTTCNYDGNNFSDNRATYQHGAPASNCKHWESYPSKKFKHLCVNTGKIFDYYKK